MALPGMAAAPVRRRWRIGLGVRLATAFLAVILLAVGTVAALAARSGTEDFRSYVAARGYGPAGPAGPGGAGGMGGGAGMMAGRAGAGPMPMPMHQAPEDWFLDRLGRSLWTAALIGGAAALLASVLIARRLTQPARALQVAARRMAAGDLHARVRITTGDELEDVGQAFNQMAESVQRQELSRRRIVADVAHDLRTPVAVIRGTVDAMLDGVYAPAPEHLRSIKEETDRLERLVGDLRDLSIADAGQMALEMAPMDVALLVAKAVERARRRASHDVRVEAVAQTGLPVVQGDVARLAQALDNLLDNALRHTPAGGRISVEASLAPPPAEAPPGSEWVALCVTDSGPGIAPEHLPHVFERFYRGDAARARAGGAGSGLGLAIVRGIVQAHGGQVRAENAPGEGARITIWLPARPAG